MLSILCLKDLDVQVKWLYGDIDDPLFTKRLNVTLGALKAKKHLGHAKVARIGGTAEGFINLSFDPDLYEKRLGVKIVDYDLPEIFEKMKNYPRKRGQGRLSLIWVSQSVPLKFRMLKWINQRD